MIKLRTTVATYVISCDYKDCSREENIYEGGIPAFWNVWSNKRSLTIVHLCDEHNQGSALKLKGMA